MGLSGTTHRRRLLRLTRGFAITLLIVGAAVAAAQAASTPAKDTFNGHIASANGKLRSDRGSVTILLNAPQSNEIPRPVELTLESPACGRAKHCLRLLGSLSGTMTALTSLPDVGRRYSLQASGRLGTLGRVSSSGMLTGVGFIAHGREGLKLTVHTSRGRLTIGALSPEVAGFTSP